MKLILDFKKKLNSESNKTTISEVKVVTVLGVDEDKSLVLVSENNNPNNSGFASVSGSLKNKMYRWRQGTKLLFSNGSILGEASLVNKNLKKYVLEI